MGLDMFAWVVEGKLPSDVDFVPNELKELQHNELHYWRKHPNLHGWMEALYREKGGSQDAFNCSPVELNADDLGRLEHDVKSKNLPHTEGFFFGQSDGSELEEDLHFIKKARKAIADGHSVFYDSWW